MTGYHKEQLWDEPYLGGTHWDGEMILDTEERLAYYGHKHMNISCRDINDDDEPDIEGLERILYGVGFLAITELTAVKAYDETTFTDSVAGENDTDEEYVSYWEMPEEAGEPDDGDGEDLLAQTATYPIDFSQETVFVADESAAEAETDEPEDAAEPAPLSDEDASPVLVLDYMIINCAL